MLKIALSLMVGIISLTPVAVAAATDQPAENPYGDVMACLGRYAPDLSKVENVSSPFAEDHSIEQTTYGFMYEEKYSGRVGKTGYCFETKQNSSATTLLPNNLDAGGHPRWFGGNLGYAALSRTANSLLLKEEYDALDRLFDDWSSLSDRTADGANMVFAFDGVFRFALQLETRASVYQKIQTWRSRSPSSVAAALAEALYWLEYADDARGQGYADTVTLEGWALYEERARKAEAILRESQAYAHSNPYWTRLLVRTGRALNWPKQRLIAAFLEQRGPQFPGSSYVAFALTPKWGGSWKLVEDFAREAAEKDRASEGNTIYATVYMSAAYDYNGINPNIFRYSLVKWPDMKQGFEDMIRRYPHSAGNLNSFAAFACMAEDKATFQSVRFLVGKSIISSSWPSGYSVDLCEHKFALQPL